MLLEPTDKGIVLWTLRYGDEVREPEETLDYKTKSDKKAQAALNQAIEKKMIDWKPSLVEDAVQKRVKSLIKTKQKSEPKPAKKKAAAKGSGAKIINIMDALKKSIADDQRKTDRRLTGYAAMSSWLWQRLLTGEEILPGIFPQG